MHACTYVYVYSLNVYFYYLVFLTTEKSQCFIKEILKVSSLSNTCWYKTNGCNFEWKKYIVSSKEVNRHAIANQYVCEIFSKFLYDIAMLFAILRHFSRPFHRRASKSLVLFYSRPDRFIALVLLPSALITRFYLRVARVAGDREL